MVVFRSRVFSQKTQPIGRRRAVTEPSRYATRIKDLHISSPSRSSYGISSNETTYNRHGGVFMKIRG